MVVFSSEPIQSCFDPITIIA